MGAATRIVDVGGRVVVPGFNDAHQHVGARPPGKGSLIYLLRRAGRAALDPRAADSRGRPRRQGHDVRALEYGSREDE
jgi:imidazolonepropionase-like amidohydrolase